MNTSSFYAYQHQLQHGIKEDGYATKPIEGDFLSKKPKEIQLQNLNKKYKAEIRHLNNINKRLAKELMLCQTRLGIPNNTKFNIENEEDMLQNFQILAGDLEYLAPLLMAYDDKLEKYEHTLNNVHSDLKDLEEKSRKLVEDNIFLRSELEKKNQQLLKNFKSGACEESVTNMFVKLEREDFIERIKLFEEENRILLENHQVLALKFGDLKSQKEAKDFEADSLHKKFTEINEKYKDTQIALEEIKRERDVLESKLNSSVESHMFLDVEKSDIISKFNRSENECKVLKSQLESIKKAFQDSEEKKKFELNSLKKENEAIKQRDRENINKIIFFERETDHFKDENRRLRKENEQKKEDNEILLKTLENYESKLQNTQRTAESLQKTMKDGKDRLEEAIVDRDKVLIRQEQHEKEIESLTNGFREEFNQQKEQNEKIVEVLKQKQSAILDKKEEEIKNLHEEMVSINIQIEKYSKDNKSLKLEIQKLNNNLLEDLNKNDEKYKQIMSEKSQLELKFEQEMHGLFEKISTLESEKEGLERMMKNLQEINTRLKDDYEKLRQYDNTLEIEIKDAKQKNQNLIKDRENLLEDCEKTKKNLEERLNNEQRRINTKEKNLMEMNQKLKESKKKCVDLFKEIDKLEEKYKNEFETRLSDLEAQNLKLVSQNKNLVIKYNQLKQEILMNQENL